MKKLFITFLLAPLCSLFIYAQNCPEGSNATSIGGGNEVTVEIISMKLNSDMEGDDDLVPFYDNKADVYGKITIDGETFDLPKMDDDNYPHWSGSGIFTKSVTNTLITIKIDLNESDGGLTGDDDDVDINPMTGKSHLDLEFDLCSMMLGGDIQVQPSRDKIEITSGSGSNQGTIHFRISALRPSTTDDLALIDVRFVQVVFDPEAMVVGKPTVVMARIANNYSTPITTNFNFSLSGSGVNIQNSTTVELKPFEVKKEYFFVDDPILFPSSSVGTNRIAYMASIDDPGSANLPGDDCKAINDGNRNRHLISVVETPLRYQILWAKTGTILDGFNMVPDTYFDSIMDLGSSYIDVIYPLSFIHHQKSPVSIIPPLSGGVLAFIATILSPFLPDAVDLPRIAEPYAMVIELDAMAYILQYDKIMGVLPSWDWFDRYPYFEKPTGLSLGEFMPQAVIFEPRSKDKGPAMTLPAHELGHTFALSVDTKLKESIDNSWVCQVDWPIIGNAGCGIVGGYDEYKSEDFPDGNPSSGYWIEQGTNSVHLASLVNTEQCNSNCFMGPSKADAHLNWSTNGKWIDNADYDHLLQKLTQQNQQTQNSMYISGLIAHNDLVYISNVFKRNQPHDIEIPDTNGVYQISFHDNNGRTLKSQNIALQWKYIEDSLVTALTPIRIITAYSNKYDHFIITNRKTKKEIYKHDLSSLPPRFEKVTLKKKCFSRSQKLAWKCQDQDSEDLKYMVLGKSGKDAWTPISNWVNKSSIDLKDTASYSAYKVLAWDQINLIESQELR